VKLWLRTSAWKAAQCVGTGPAYFLVTGCSGPWHDCFLCRFSHSTALLLSVTATQSLTVMQSDSTGDVDTESDQ